MSTEPERRRRRADVVGILEPDPHPLATVTIAFGTVLVLTLIGFFLGSVDIGLAAASNALHVGAVGALATAVYHVISPGPAIAITVVVAGVVWWRARDVRPALAFGMTKPDRRRGIDPLGTRGRTGGTRGVGRLDHAPHPVPATRRCGGAGPALIRPRQTLGRPCYTGAQHIKQCVTTGRRRPRRTTAAPDGPAARSGGAPEGTPPHAPTTTL
ncbi:hypothetical protein [Curtobacterium sp. MCSS17_008]|uniref:hypothetical protein n=1 Tax=Curtobacterium sp. MCSS17_008 TaxID=2175647 RepID=UPI0011B5F40A|nr:hypothetical protein [Curtobacterium sp. MCSS17_008]